MPIRPRYLEPPANTTPRPINGGFRLFERMPDGSQELHSVVLWERPLEQKIMTCQLATGERIAAAVSQGFRRAGENQDRLLVMPRQSRIVVADGFGPEGEEVADRLIALQMHFPENRSISASLSALLHLEEFGSRSGACMIAADIVQRRNQEKWLEYTQWGDVRVAALSANGSIKESSDENYATELKERGEIDPDEAHYHPDRKSVTNALGWGVSPLHIREREIGPLKPGDRLIVASDGIFGNLTSEEIQERIRGEADVQALRLIVRTCLKRAMGRLEGSNMCSDDERKSAGCYPDGFKTKPVVDNWSIAVTTIK